MRMKWNNTAKLYKAAATPALLHMPAAWPAGPGCMQQKARTLSSPNSLGLEALKKANSRRSMSTSASCAVAALRPCRSSTGSAWNLHAGILLLHGCYINCAVTRGWANIYRHGVCCNQLRLLGATLDADPIAPSIGRHHLLDILNKSTMSWHATSCHSARLLMAGRARE
jgi:hypothetical protein